MNQEYMNMRMAAMLAEKDEALQELNERQQKFAEMSQMHNNRMMELAAQLNGIERAREEFEKLMAAAGESADTGAEQPASAPPV